MPSVNHDYSNVNKTIELAFDNKELAFSNEAKIKPFVYSVILNENISSSFDAKFVIYLKKKLTASELKDHLQKKIYITLRQVRDDGVELRRQNLFGMVTGYRSLGLVSESKDSDFACYKYELSVHSLLSRLSINRKNCTYQGTVGDVLSTILKNYSDSIACDLTDIQGKAEDFSLKELVFSQSNESDLAYINRLCRFFGINYTLVYNTENRMTVICFSKNWANKVNLKNPKDYLHNADFSNSIPDVFTEFLIDSAQYHGVYDECSIFDEKSDLSKRDYQFEVARLSCIGIRGLEDDSQKLNEFDLKKHFINSIKNTESRLVAVSYDIGYTPGLILDISNIEDCGAPAGKFIVTGRSLKFRQKFSSDYMISDGSTEKDFQLKQIIMAVPVDSSRYPGSFDRVETVTVADDDVSLCTVGGIRPVIRPKNSVREMFLKNALPTVMEATVIDRPECVGEISDTELQSVFYARINSYLFGGEETNQEHKYIAVQLFKAESELAYKLPHKGQKVLVLHADGRYYSLGIINVNDGRSVYSKNQKAVMQNSSIMTIDDKHLSFDDDLSNYDVKNNYSGFLKFSSPDSLIEHLFMQGNLLRFAKNLDSVHNVLYFSNALSQKDDSTGASKLDTAKALRIELVNARAAYSQKLKSYRGAVEDAYIKGNKTLGSNLLQDLEKARSSLDSCLGKVKNFVYGIVDAFNAVTVGSHNNLLNLLFADEENSNSEITNYEVNATNDVSITSDKGVVSLQGSKVNINSDSDINFDSGRNISFVADKKISFQVGASTLEISDTGIKLVASQYGNKAGVLSSQLSLDGVNGTTLTGDIITIKGIERVLVADSFGGSMSVSAGNAKIAGMKFDVSTLNTLGKINSTIGMINTISNSIGAATGGDPVTKFINAATTSNLSTMNADLYAVQCSFLNRWRDFKQYFSDTGKILNAVQLSFETLTIAMELVMSYQNLIFDTSLACLSSDSDSDKEAEKRIRAELRKANLIEWCIKFSSMGLQTATAYVAHGFSQSAISVVPEAISSDSTQIKIASKSQIEVKSATAGLPQVKA